MESQGMKPNELLFLNLKILGFDTYQANSQHSSVRSISFNGSMFDYKNQSAFQAVTHFLVTICGHAFSADKFLTQMKPCFPSLERNQEVDFRKIVVEFFQVVEKDKDYNSKLRLPIANIVQEPGGHKFILLYLRFTNMILMRKVDRDSRSTVRDIVIGTPQPKICNLIKSNLDGVNESRKKMNESKEKFFNDDLPVIESFSEVKRMIPDWTESVSNSCQCVLRSLSKPDVKPLVVNVKSEVSILEEKLDTKLNKVSKFGQEIILVSKSLKSIGCKLPELNFGHGQLDADPIGLIKKSTKIQKSLETQLLSIPSKVIEDKSARLSILSGHFGKTKEELEVLKYKLTTMVQDEGFEKLKRKVLEIPKVRERYDRLRKQLVPSRDPVLDFGFKRSTRLPRGWWRAKVAARNGLDCGDNGTNGIKVNGKNDLNESNNNRESNVSMDNYSFNFVDISAIQFNPRTSLLSPTTGDVIGITDQSSLGLVDLDD